MPETKKPETKREEFRRYLGNDNFFDQSHFFFLIFNCFLDQAGLLDLLTQFLVTLYEEPEKPQDAVAYMKKTLTQG